MISYKPLWATMENRGASTYTLQVKGEISSSTIRRLKADESVSTNTLDALCKILHCTIPDIIEFIPGKQFVKGVFSAGVSLCQQVYKGTV